MLPNIGYIHFAYFSEMKPKFFDIVEDEDVPNYHRGPFNLLRLLLRLTVVRVMQLPVQLAAVCRLLEQETKAYKLAMFAVNTLREV